MFRHLFLTAVVLISSVAAHDESFILVDGKSGNSLCEFGNHLDERATPGCTFNIAISLMGFDSGLLLNEEEPVWDFCDGYMDNQEIWRQAHYPRTWMRHSCVWYSQQITQQLGAERIEDYLSRFGYGNGDMSGSVTRAWIGSSLKISPREQVAFLKQIVSGDLPASPDAITYTKNILLLETLPDGGKLHGKSGLASFVDDQGRKIQVRSLVGWVEKDNSYYPFAYQLRAEELDYRLTLGRVKQLLELCYVSRT